MSGARELADGYSIRQASEDDIPALLPLVRAYTDFYETSPSDEGLENMCRALISDPDNEGPLLVGVAPGGEIAGFAGMRWKWSSLRGARIGFLEDLFVDPAARGSGLADALLLACAERARAIGAPVLAWETDPDNLRAQAVYDRVGGVSEALLEYELEL
jgi:ribosomal protein S18 acetylase RimI-like enzyme